MKLRISRDELLTALQRVQGVVEKRNTMPILANILLEAIPDKCSTAVAPDLVRFFDRLRRIVGLLNEKDRRIWPSPVQPQ